MLTLFPEVAEFAVWFGTESSFHRSPQAGPNDYRHRVARIYLLLPKGTGNSRYPYTDEVRWSIFWLEDERMLAIFDNCLSRGCAWLCGDETMPQEGDGSGSGTKKCDSECSTALSALGYSRNKPPYCSMPSCLRSLQAPITLSTASIILVVTTHRKWKDEIRHSSPE